VDGIQKAIGGRSSPGGIWHPLHGDDAIGYQLLEGVANLVACEAEEPGDFPEGGKTKAVSVGEAGQSDIDRYRRGAQPGAGLADKFVRNPGKVASSGA